MVSEMQSDVGGSDVATPVESMPVNPIFEKDQAMLNNNFVYHAPKPGQNAKYERLRSEAKFVAENILRLCPPSRERSMALTELEASIFWANAAIARNE